MRTATILRLARSSSRKNKSTRIPDRYFSADEDEWRMPTENWQSNFRECPGDWRVDPRQGTTENNKKNSPTGPKYIVYIAQESEGTRSFVRRKYKSLVIRRSTEKMFHFDIHPAAAVPVRVRHTDHVQGR